MGLTTGGSARAAHSLINMPSQLECQFSVKLCPSPDKTLKEGQIFLLSFNMLNFLQGGRWVYLMPIPMYLIGMKTSLYENALATCFGYESITKWMH
jgi:hypothetical protein